MTTTILIIDDSEDDLLLYRRAFKDFDDFRLVTASSADSGFAHIADASPDSNRPDLILLDYNLPDMDGLSFIKRLSEYSDAFVPVPIIMLTGEDNAAVAVEAMKNGVDDYIVKDTEGRYLRLLPGVAGRVMAAHAQREETRLLRQQTEALLLRNQILMQNSRDGIHILDIRGNIVEANDAFCRMLGYTQEEMARLNVADWDAQWLAEELQERLKDHIVRSSRFETVHRRKDGSLINVEISTSAMEIDGQFFVFANSRDITQRKRADEELKLNAQLLNIISDSVFLFDIDGNFVYLNEAAWKSRGYTLDEMMAMNLRELNTPEFGKLIAPRIKELLENGHGIFETEHRCKDGSVIAVEISSRVIESGGRRLVLAVIRDITERKKSEGVLQLNKTIIETAYDGFWLFDTNGYLLDVNQAYAEMAGYTREELLGKHISQLSAQSNTPELVRARLDKAIGQGSGNFETQHHHKDGHVMDFEASIAYIPEANCLFSFIRDISKRKKAEAVLKWHKQVVDTSLDGFWVNDLQGNLLEANEAYATMSGYTVEELLNMKISQLEATEQPADVKEHTAKIFAQGHDRFVTRHRRKDGREIDIEVSATYIAEARQIFAFFRDITERKKTEEALRVAAITFESDDAIIITDPDANIIRVNRAFTNITGYSADEVLGKNPRMFSSGRHDRSFYVAMWEQLLQAGSWSGEIWDKRKNGAIYPKWMTITAVKNERQQIIQYVSISSDITARIQAEKELLHESDERFRITLEQAAVGIAHTNLDGTFKQINQKLCEILGFHPDELVRLSIQEVTFPDDLHKDRVYMQQILANQISTFAVEKRFVRKNQTLVWVNLTISLLRINIGSPKYFIFVVEDITERKAAERKILRLNELYAVISRVNEAIVRIADQGRLLDEICRIASVHGRFKLAWVGLVDGTTRDLKVVASSGEATGYLANLHITADADKPEGRGPTGMAIRNNREYVCNDFLNDPNTRPWRESAKTYGLRADASYPLELEGQVVGALTLYADEVNYFDQDMTNLLIVLAKDISLALNNFVRKDRRRRAELELEKSRQMLRELVAQSEALREEERKHIAREIHDELGQILTALRMDVALLRLQFGARDAALLEKTQDITLLLDRAIQGVRNVASNLRPTALDMGIISAIEWLCNEFIEHTGVSCVVRTTEKQIELNETLAVAVFRIVQESLTNIARHAEANSVEITLAQGADALHVSVCDNGRGFDSASISSLKSFGLLGMSERAIALGGAININSAPQQGTAVSLRIPTKPESGDLPTNGSQ